MMPPSVNAGMSAFPESGRSDHRKITKMKVRFRPEADVLKRSNLQLFEPLALQPFLLYLLNPLRMFQCGSVVLSDCFVFQPGF